jgi:hypothetical protein
MGEIIIIGDVLKIAVLYSLILFKMVSLNYIPRDFYEQAIHIREPRTNFTVSPRSSNSLSAILKNILELDQGTNRNQEVRQ